MSSSEMPPSARSTATLTAWVTATFTSVGPPRPTSLSAETPAFFRLGTAQSPQACLRFTVLHPFCAFIMPPALVSPLTTSMRYRSSQGQTRLGLLWVKLQKPSMFGHLPIIMNESNDALGFDLIIPAISATVSSLG